MINRTFLVGYYRAVVHTCFVVVAVVAVVSNKPVGLSFDLVVDHKLEAAACTFAVAYTLVVERTFAVAAHIVDSLELVACL